MLTSNPKYSIVQFEQRHVDQTSKMIVTSFLQQNPMWKGFQPEAEVMIPYIRLEIIKCLNQPASLVLVDEGGIVIGANLANDCIDFFNPNQLKYVHSNKMYLGLENVNKVLFSGIRDLKYSRGEHLYAYFGVINPLYKDQGMATQLFQTSFQLAKILGVKSIYFRVTNDAALIVLKKLGATIIKQAEIDNPQVGLSKYNIYLVQLQLDKFQPTKPRL